MSINRKDYIDRISTLPNESLEDIVFSHKLFKGYKGAYCYGIALELIPNDYYCVVIGLSNYNIIYY